MPASMAPVCALALAAVFSAAASAEDATPPLVNQLDSLVAQAYSADGPGASVIVVSKGQVLLRKGYGMADLELGVPVDPVDTFRLGSITKQFTAVAILQLVEAGKISLDDDITKYVPEVQTGGHKITLTHLLTHTSGLPSFTDQPEFRAARTHEMTLSETLALIKDKPAHFAPGTDWAYCNTGFRLLGAVIEKVSGQRYGDYVEDHIFKPAGMTHSGYGWTDRIFPGRVPGYTQGSDGKPANAPYIGMSVPHGAGALMSSVDDLWKWEQALAAGKLVSPALLARAYTPVRLEDGRSTGYGFGWGIGSLSGHETVEHGGGIEGFSTYVIRVADAGVYVAVLVNSDRPKAPPGVIARRLASLVLGKAVPVASVTVGPDVLQKYAGVYRLSGDWKLGFVVENGQLVIKRQGGSSIPLQARSQTEFFAPDSEVLFEFIPDPAGAAQRLLRHPAQGPDSYGIRVAEPLEDPVKPSVSVASELLDQYIGDYQLAPDFILTVRRVGTNLTAQATGQGATDLVAESLVRFHVKQVKAAIEFKTDANGRVTSLVLFQNGNEIPAKRVEANQSKSSAELRSQNAAPAPAPSWTLKDLGGNAVSSSQFKGKVLVVDFWATWCAGCVSEMPGYEALQSKYASEGAVFVGVSMDQKAADAKGFVGKHGITYRIVMADKDVANAFGVQALPGTFIIDRDGLIADRTTGVVVETADFEKALLKVLRPVSPAP